MKKRSLKAAANSLHVSVGEMETDLRRRPNDPVDVDFHVRNLKAHVKELAGVREIDQVEFVARKMGKGEMSVKHFAQVTEVLRALSDAITRNVRNMREDQDSLGELLGEIRQDEGIVGDVWKAMTPERQRKKRKAARKPKGRAMKRGPMYAKMMAQGEDIDLEEAKVVKRSKNKAIVATMDALKAEMTKAGWKHQQMGSVDIYSRKSTDQEKTAKGVAAILKKHDLKGFHNREDDEYETKWTFEHPRYRQFLAFLTAHKHPMDKGHVGLHVQDQAMVR